MEVSKKLVFSLFALLIIVTAISGAIIFYFRPFTTESAIDDECPATERDLTQMSVEDLNDLGNDDPRCVANVSHFYMDKALEFIEEQTQHILHEIKDYEDYDDDGRWMKAFRFSREVNCTQWTAKKLVLSFKYSAFLVRMNESNTKRMNELLIDAVKPLSEMSKENEIEEFAQILTFHDHYAIFLNLERRWDYEDIDVGWICYAYMMILEKSKHLKNQFTYEMMKKMNKIRNIANAHYLLYKELNSSSEKFEYVDRFKIDWSLSKGDISSDDAKQKFKLALTQNEIEILDEKVSRHLFGADGTKYFARVYCAIRSLSGPNFTQLVDASNLDLALFDLQTESKFVRKLRESLGLECKDCKVLTTGLQQQLNDIDAFIGGGAKGTANDFLILIGANDKYPNEYVLNFKQRLEIEIESLQNATDFTGYIKLLKICKKLPRYHSSYGQLKKVFDNLYFAYFTFVDRPNAFNDPSQLSEVDALHIQFKEYEKNGRHNGRLLKMIFQNFETTVSPRDDDTSEFNTNKQRVLLKMMLFLDDGNVNENKQRIEISKFFYSLAHLHGEVLSKDKILLRESFHYYQKLDDDLKNLLTRGHADEFGFVYRPVNISGNINKDANIYLFMLNTARMIDHMSDDDEVWLKTPNLLENIIALEQSIGSAEEAEQWLRNDILQAKLKFHANFWKVIVRKGKDDLKNFVESTIDLLLNKIDKYTYDFVATKILMSIFVAIRENLETAKAQLGDDLIERLRILSKGSELTITGFKYIRKDYEACKEILNL